MIKIGFCRNIFGSVMMVLAVLVPMNRSVAQTWTNALDDEALYLNQNPAIETRRSAHFRIVFGHDNWDTYGWTEQMAQGNLQMFEQLHNRWINDLGFWDCGQSYNFTSNTNYRFNFNILMTFNTTDGGGAYNSEDGNGFFYGMANASYCRYDPMSGATPHEIGDAWCGYGKGIVGTIWGNLWECTGNWMMLQGLNTYPQAGDYEQNGMYSPLNGRCYFGSWPILEMALQAPGFGSGWINNLYTNATTAQRANEYWVARMQRIPNTTGLADATNAVNDLWGNMAKRLVTWDFQKQIWLSSVNGSIGGGPSLPNTVSFGADSGMDWVSYQRDRCTLLPLPGTNGWYRIAYEDAPQQQGWNIIPLKATPGSTVTCNFQPLCDPIRQSGWRACLVAVSTNIVSLGQGNTNNFASYSALWNCGANSITLSADQTKLYLVVVATPAPTGIYGNTSWNAYITETGLQFPYAVSFSNAAPLNVVYAQTNGYAWKSYINPDGSVCPRIATTATVTAPAYVGSNCMVLDSATVSGNAQVLDYAVVGGNAQVYGNAIVSGHALVANYAQVYGFGKVRDWAEVFGYAQVYGYGKVIEHGNCGDGTATAYSTVSGSAMVKGTTYDYAGTYLAGSVIMDGDSADGGDEPVVHTNGVHFGWGWPGIGTPFTSYSNPNTYQYCGLTFENTPNSTSTTVSSYTNNACFAMDEFGINHGFLMNGCGQTIDSGTSKRGGYVLALNGTNQYVELHNSVNDFNDTTIAVWFKTSGGASGQPVWSMGNGSNKVMYLTPNDSTTGNLRFMITDGNTTNYLNGGAVPVSTWTHAAVVFAQATSNSVLYVNGLPVATNSAITLFPDSLNAPLMANANYLGRGNGGKYFQGSVDDFRVFMRSFAASDVLALFNTASPAAITPVTDTTAPTPNPPTWLTPPYSLGDSIITMSATPGSDASGWVQYYFSNNTVLGHDSGWVSFNNYTDGGLAPGTTYTYTVIMRDRYGNTTTNSTAQSATTQTSGAGTASFAYGPVGYVNGQITMAAAVVTNASGKTEYSFACTAGGGHSSGWIASPSWTDSGLTTGGSYSYTVTVRDGRGNTSAASAAVPAKAEDDAAPQLYSNPLFQWSMTPYPTISNGISMTAQAPGDPSGVQYDFHCTSSNAPDSGWQSSATYVTPALTNGAYYFVYMLRDQSPQANQSGYCTATYPAVITPTTGYQPCTFAQLATLANDDLVTFTGVVTAVTATQYTVRDTASTNSVTVGTTNFASGTLPALIFNTVSVSGHLYNFTNSPGRSVTFSMVNSVGISSNSISGTVTNLSGAPISGITVYFSTTPNAATNPIATVITDALGRYNLPIINGTWYVCSGSAAYFTSADQTVVINSANVTNVNFALLARPTVGGRVTDLAGNPIAGASVFFSTTPDAGHSPTYAATTGVTGAYLQIITNGTWYVAAGASNYLLSADQTITAVANGALTNLNFALAQPATRTVPQSSQLIFASFSDALPLSGGISNWPNYYPAGTSLSIVANPVAQVTAGKRWASLLYTLGDGFTQANYTTNIPCSGASIVAVVQPTQNGNAYASSCVDVFYNRLVLGLRTDNGQVVVKRNGTTFTGSIPATAVPNGQIAVLSLVVQPTGTYNIYINGVLVTNITSTSTMTTLTNGTAGKKSIWVGCDPNSAQSTFNGNIGDVFLYNVALSDADRQTLENDLISRFSTSAAYTITASAGAGGSMVPQGAVTVVSGTNQTFTFTPSASLGGWNMSNVVVDGVSQGAISSYTFTNVAANHTIAAAFVNTNTLFTITASAGVGGAISPAGSAAVVAAANQSFTISPATGYQIAGVQVDGVPQGAISNYTFNNVATNHTIAATFSIAVLSITASASSGGAISPSGGVAVNYGASQTFTVTTNSGYLVTSVIVDGVNQGPLFSYTFNSVTSNHVISASFAPAPIPGGILSVNYYLGGGSTPPESPASSAGVVAATNWNNVTRTSSGGFASPTNIFYTSDGLSLNGFDVYLSTEGFNTWSTSGTANQNLYGDWALNGGGTVTFANIPYPTYNLYVYFMGFGGNNNVQYTIGADTETMVGLAGASPGTLASFVQNQNFVVFTGLTNSNPVMTVSGVSGGNSGMAAFQLIQTAQTCTITATARPGGIINPSGAVSVGQGGNQTFTMAANPGYGISNVVVDGVSQGAVGSYVFTNVANNHIITATFSNITCTITASAGANGTVSPSGSVLVNYGSSQTFTITGSAGYGVGTVVVDGLSQGAISAYTFTNLTANHSLSATFVLLPPPGVDNSAGASNVTAGVAQLRGALTFGPADVRLYWGTSDGGTNGSWANTNLLAGTANGSFASPISNLFYGLTYYYRAYASNAVGTAWVPATAAFTTVRPTGLAAGMVPFSNLIEVAASEEQSGGGYEVVNAFDGAGLSGATHGTTTGFWVSDGDATSNQWVRVHFNAEYPLDYLRIWNYNETGFEAESLKSADIYTLDSDVDPGNNLEANRLAFNATGWTRGLTNQVFVKAPGGAETNTDPHLSLGGVMARQLAFKINANYSSGSDVWVGLSQVQIYNLAMPAISLTNRGATSITNNAASLNGVLTCNGAVYYVYACWSTTNGGTNAAAWGNSAHAGTWTNAASASLGFTATGLTPNTSYYYTFFATNASETLWATNVQSFTTLIGPTPPVLSAASLTLPGGVPTFAIPSTLLGYQYTLVCKTNLTDPAWLPLAGSGTAAGTGSTLTLSDPNPARSKTQRFYRIQMQ